MKWYALALIPFAAPAILAGQDPNPILERSAAVYRDLTSLEAHFDQVVDNDMIGRMESSGRLYQTGESKLAMRFDDPPNEAIVVDGTFIWVYTPSATPNQVTRLPLPDAPTYGLNVLSWILDEPTVRYHSQYLETTTVEGHLVDVIELQPRDPSLPFTMATVWLDRASALPRRIALVETSGTRRSFDLSDFTLNRRLPDGTFTFQVPRGVEVIDQS